LIASLAAYRDQKICDIKKKKEPLKRGAADDDRLVTSIFTQADKLLLKSFEPASTYMRSC